MDCPVVPHASLCREELARVGGLLVPCRLMEELTEPKDLREWAARVLTLHVFVLAGVMLAMIFAELKLHWVERAIGAYLVSTNSDRPESGAIWEKGRKTRSARSAVERLASDREAYQRMARNAGNLSEIVGSLTPGQGAMLSAEHFREIYQKIPQGLAAEMISPFELLRVANEGRWSRTYLEKSSDGLVVYLLEPNNHVLRQFKLASASLAILTRRTEASSQTLEDVPGFQSRIYSAERFFTALTSLAEDERRGLIPQPERLLEVSGQITRVGISDEVLAGFVDIGFEIRSASQRRVLLIQGQDWAVWRLRSLLEGKSPGSRAGKGPLEGHSPQ